MNQIRILFRKNLLEFSRARAAIVITFLVPIVLIYLFGHVFGLYRRESGPTGITLAVINASDAPAAQQLVKALQAEKTFRVITDVAQSDGSRRPLTEQDAREGLRANDYRFALILPADLLPADQFGLRMKFLSNPRNEMEAQLVSGMLQKTVFSHVPQLLGLSLQAGARRFLGDARYQQFNDTIATAVSGAFGGDRDAIRRRMESGDFLGLADREETAPNATRAESPDPASGAPAPARRQQDVFSRIVRIENEQVAGMAVKNPMAARLVGGYAIMFLLFAVSGSASTLFEEKRTGVFQRLLSSPVRPAHILWARFLFGIVLGLVQLTALFLAGRVFFGLEVFQQGAALFLITLSAAAACSSFGILVAVISPNAAAAGAIATLVVLSMSAIGGAWFPVSFMPPFIQSVSKLTLVYWAVEGMTDVLWAGRTLLEVLPKAVILLGIAAGVMVFSSWRFNRTNLFD